MEFNDRSSGTEDLDASGKEILPGNSERPVVCREAQRTEGGDILSFIQHGFTEFHVCSRG